MEISSSQELADHQAWTQRVYTFASKHGYDGREVTRAGMFGSGAYSWNDGSMAEFTLTVTPHVATASASDRLDPALSSVINNCEEPLEN